MHFPTRFLDILAICTLCDDDYKDSVESAGALHKVYWRAYVYHTQMNTITMSTVRLTADSDAHVTVKHVTVIHVTIVVYVDNSAWTVSTCNARLLYTCTVAIHNIDAMCRKNRWNFVAKTKFCHILDNLRHLSVLETIKWCLKWSETSNCLNAV